MKSKANKFNNKIKSNIKGDSIYKSHYDNLLSKASSPNYLLEEYTEVHHIVPKSLDGSNDKSNLIRVNYLDHFNLHKLLMLHFDSIKCVLSTLKMSSAFLFMCNTHKGGKISNGREFSIAKNLDRKNKIDAYGNPMGQCHTEEARRKIIRKLVSKYGSSTGQMRTEDALNRAKLSRKLNGTDQCIQLNTTEVRSRANLSIIAKYGYLGGNLHTEKAKATKVRLYGNPMGQCHTEEAKSKSLATRLEKYGTPFVNCSSDSARKKVRDSNIKKFGSAMGQCHTEEARKANVETRKERFGNACGQMHSMEIREKSNATKKLLYGNVCGMMHTKESKQKGRDTTRARMIESNEFLGKGLILLNKVGEIEYQGVAYDVVKYLGAKWQTVVNHVGTNLSIRSHGKWKNYLLNYSEESSETIPSGSTLEV